MPDTGYRFGISEFTTQPGSFDEDVARYARLGVDTIEVVEAKLDDGRFADQMESIAAAGLGISGVQPAVRTFFGSRMKPDPAGLDERCAALRGLDRAPGPARSPRARRRSAATVPSSFPRARAA